MKLQARIDDTEHTVEIVRNGNKVSALVDGREYDIDVSEPEPNVLLLKKGARIFEATVTSGSGTREMLSVSLSGKSYDVTITDPKRLRSSTTDSEHGDGLAEIKSGMPGKVVRILVQEGDSVEKGDGVVVVEAMKMQNELKSPKAGIVSTIKVPEGQTVNAGDVLIVIE